MSIFNIHAGPKQSPTQLYATSIDSTGAVVHWTYEETPQPGNVVGFAIYIYNQIPGFPESQGTRERRFFDNVATRSSQTSFSHTLTDYFEASESYNIFVAAATIVGEGPRARLSITALREGISHKQV